MQYRAGIAWVTFVGTHAQCDSIDVESVNDYSKSYRPLVTDYRLLLANIGGAWKVSGTNTFSYHFGC
jgi:hypothetical protein